MTEKNRRPILHLISSAGFLGADSVVLELAKQSVDAGRSVTVGQFENQRNPHIELAEAAKNLDLSMKIFPCRGRLDLRTIGDLRRFIQREKPALIHSHGYKSNFYALSANRNRVPWVVTNHLWKRTSLSLKLYARMDSFLIRFSKKIVAVSDEIADDMVKLGISPHKIAVIDNGIDLKRFSHGKKNDKLKSALGFDIHSKVIGTVASLTAEKGHIYLMNAAKAILSSYPEVRFLFVGDGAGRRNLEEKMADLGLQGKIFFAGSRKDIPDLLSILEIFVLPSLKEGLPMALLEAMAAHVPIVATEVGAVPTVVEDGITGTLIPPKEPGVLADAVIRILSDRKRALDMAERGFKKVRDHFSSEQMASKYLSLYEDLIDGPEC